MPDIGQRLSICMTLSIWWLSIYSFLMVSLGLALLDLLLPLMVGPGAAGGSVAKNMISQISHKVNMAIFSSY